MTVASPRHVHLSTLAFLEAAGQLGWPRSPDLSGSVRTGVGLADSAVRDGRRHSAFEGFLSEALARPNLTVIAQASVERIELDERRVATGVRFRGHGRPGVDAVRGLRARRGVVLCAGALRSPQLLMLSGVGPPGALARLGVPTMIDLPGVGTRASRPSRGRAPLGPRCRRSGVWR